MRAILMALILLAAGAAWLSSNATARAELRVIRDAIATNINDAQAIDGTTAQQLTALRRELVDALQTQRQLLAWIRRNVARDITE